MKKSRYKTLERRHIQGKRFMKVSVDFNEGSSRRAKGFYLSLTPVVDNGNYETTVLAFGAMSGYCIELLLESPRFNQRMLDRLTLESIGTDKITAHITALLPHVHWADDLHGSTPIEQACTDLVNG